MLCEAYVIVMPDREPMKRNAHRKIRCHLASLAQIFVWSVTPAVLSVTSSFDAGSFR